MVNSPINLRPARLRLAAALLIVPNPAAGFVVNLEQHVDQRLHQQENHLQSTVESSKSAAPDGPPPVQSTTSPAADPGNPPDSKTGTGGPPDPNSDRDPVADSDKASECANFLTTQTYDPFNEANDRTPITSAQVQEAWKLLRPALNTVNNIVEKILEEEKQEGKTPRPPIQQALKFEQLVKEATGVGSAAQSAESLVVKHCNPPPGPDMVGNRNPAHWGFLTMTSVGERGDLV